MQIGSSTSQPQLITIDETDNTSIHPPKNSIFISNSKDRISRLINSKFIVKGLTNHTHHPRNSLQINKIKKSIEDTHRREGSQRGRVRVGSIIDRADIYSPVLLEESFADCFNFQSISNPQSAGIKNRPKSAFQKSSSEYNLMSKGRPDSAINTKRVERPSTANQSKSFKASFSRQPSARQMSTIDKSDGLRTIASSSQFFNQKNYIEQNKKQFISKKGSFYLTNLSEKKLKIPKKKIQRIDKQYEEYPLKRVIVTEKQRQTYKKQGKQYVKFMKENMPQQYSRLLVQTVESTSKNTGQNLVSFGLKQKEPVCQDGQTYEQFYSDFYQVCNTAEYAMKRISKKPQKPAKSEKSMLTIDEVEKVVQFSANKQTKRERKDQLKYILRQLSFFRKLERNILQTFFEEIQFRIRQVEQDEILIRQGDGIQNISVIVSGSVSREDQKNESSTGYNNNDSMPIFSFTLFQGDYFGLPSHPNLTSLDYSITTLVKTWLLEFPSSSYKSLLMRRGNVEFKLETLCSIFELQIKNKKLKKQDLEMLAIQFRSIQNIPSNKIVYRMGEICSQLVVVAEGELNICIESVLERKKKKQDGSKFLKLKPELKVQNFPLRKLKRDNLINYQMLAEDQQKMLFYYQYISGCRNRGDILNWSGFLQNLQGKPTSELPFSIISASNRTKILVLSPDKMNDLPSHIAEAIKQKGMSLKSKKETIDQKGVVNQKGAVAKWDCYKQKVFQDVMRNSKFRNNRK